MTITLSPKELVIVISILIVFVIAALRGLYSCFSEEGEVFGCFFAFSALVAFVVSICALLMM